MVISNLESQEESLYLQIQGTIFLRPICDHMVKNSG